MVIPLISPNVAFGHLAQHPVRARTQSAHNPSAPIGAFLWSENPVRAAILAASLGCRAPILAVRPNQWCRVLV